ncbi:hypothetical protein Dimus_029058 [Dionaea muscipula]
MKNKGPVLVKPIISLLRFIRKVKLMDVKRNVVTMRARLGALSWLRSRKLSLGLIPLGLRALIDRKDYEELEDGEDLTKANVLYKDAMASGSYSNTGEDVTSSAYIFGGGDNVGKDDCSVDDVDDDMEGLVNGSVIEMAKRARENEGGDFSLEGEIDHVADLFIKRLHKQIRLQKLESFKRYQEKLELERGA